MNSLVSKARWLGALVAAAALLLAGAGSAGADDAPDGPVRGLPGTVVLDSPPFSEPASVAVSPDGRKAYVSVKDGVSGVKLKVVDTQSGTIAATVTLTTEYGANAGPVAVSPDGSRVYVLFGAMRLLPLSTLSAVDTATNTVVSTTLAPNQPRPDGTGDGGLSALTVSPDGSRVYVTQDGPSLWHQPTQPGARVLEFSPQQQAFTAAVTVPGRSLGSVVTRPDGAGTYVSTDEGLVHLDTSVEPPAVTGTVATPSTKAALALTPDGTRVYGVSSTGTGYTLDPATDTVTATMNLGITRAQALTSPSMSPDGTRLYIACLDYASSTGRVRILSLDTSTNTLVPAEAVTGLNFVTGLAAGPDGHTLYIVDGALKIVGI
ncbi:YncE family protein [Kitasatospora sp. NPDC093558]|uniref:YncE family protein n=1 Tax=Kitasatospora sp. NPDC093558 TaxID=3155201 RepID=UPI00342B02BA